MLRALPTASDRVISYANVDQARVLPLGSTTPLTFKIATEAWEFEQIHRLNYRTFVNEIPQHAPNPEGRLVDKFHNENTYIICLRGRQLVGMVALRAKRPFSLDAKLPNIDDYLPPHRSVCESRMLAVEFDVRNGQVLVGLLKQVFKYVVEHGHDLVVASGTVRQLRLYRHLGWVAFGPLVGTRDAKYQPMYLSVETFTRKFPWISKYAKEVELAI